MKVEIKKLESGLIPKGKECPFWTKCKFDCALQEGKTIDTGMSCGLARAFDMFGTGEDSADIDS